MIDNVNMIFSIIGGILFIFCIQKVFKIIKMFPNAKMTKSWKIINVLIIIFLVGYILNIVAILMNLNQMMLIMLGLMYLFGGIFVYLVVSLSLRTYKIILESAENEADNGGN